MFILPSHVIKALELIEKFPSRGVPHGGGVAFEGYLIGGCVRDFLLCKTPADYDITTNAAPEQILKIFKGFTAIETGKKFGCITVIIDNQKVEISTYRADGAYTDKRRPDSVRFSNTLKEDVSRRDFTVNAMAYNPKTGVIDYYGGQEDLKNKLIRCVGNPEARFEEDGLRILRALRFASVLGFDIHAGTKAAMYAKKQNLNILSAERVFSELKKIICGQSAEKILTEYHEILSVILPEIAPVFNFEQNNKYHIYDVYTHTVKVIANIENTPVLRLAALFHDIGKPHCYTEDKNGVGHFYGHDKISCEIADRILRRLKADNKTRLQILTLIKFHDYNLKADKISVKKLLNKIGEENFDLLLLLKRADIKAQNPEFSERLKQLDCISGLKKEVIENKECYLMKDLKINGNDLINLGLNDNTKIGETLEKMLEFVISGKLENNYKALKNFALQNIKIFSNRA